MKKAARVCPRCCRFRQTPRRKIDRDAQPTNHTSRAPKKEQPCRRSASFNVAVLENTSENFCVLAAQGKAPLAYRCTTPIRTEEEELLPSSVTGKARTQRRPAKDGPPTENRCLSRQFFESGQKIRTQRNSPRGPFVRCKKVFTRALGTHLGQIFSPRRRPLHQASQHHRGGDTPPQESSCVSA